MSDYVCSTCEKKCQPDGFIFTPSRVAYRCTDCRKIICSDCATSIIVKDCLICSNHENFDKL